MDEAVGAILDEILDEARATRQAKARSLRGHQRLELVEPHTLPKSANHPHHLVISSATSRRTKMPSGVITRFEARCKVCGEDDTWATREVEGLEL